jgi:hypothetical protein
VLLYESKYDCMCGLYECLLFKVNVGRLGRTQYKGGDHRTMDTLSLPFDSTSGITAIVALFPWIGDVCQCYLFHCRRGFVSSLNGRFGQMFRAWFISVVDGSR